MSVSQLLRRSGGLGNATPLSRSRGRGGGQDIVSDKLVGTIKDD
ncbi:predicted protein [Chaetomium globosum CBS 148.51]|uniref:Uncharacterized protein n=1 Tax=Chaetomium globosum (strain ATCC 6205 / CBS 148.51 / DSM 1962 / NBRC 6347 / NRRL 1970) TaxID=306901 RepID=Q2GYS6_CHAGB|nr:uncharacterized protein CHGG_06878 [Chaetomium globosum CBS 148.51]EAQ85625.1 predicted protein [Chaetomium globosum CBS 148.51]